MYKLLEDGAQIKVKDRWYTAKAVLITSSGGKRHTVEYLDTNNNVLKSQPLSKSPYRDMAGCNSGHESE